MKNSVAERAAFERMKPGKIVAQGFLGEDGRGLADIVAADEEEMARLGIGFEEAAAALERLCDAGSLGLGEPATVGGGFVVSVGDARGRLPCPFGDGFHRKNSVEVAGPDGAFLAYSDLSLHLLRAHHFCQGRGSPYRLEPGALKRAMDGGFT
jgi:hypothetical protein